MSQILLVAQEEWRHWIRSNLMLSATAVFVGLLVTASVMTALRIDAERHTRLHQQAEAEAAFVAQPDRHPHRMVHYGHYVFRLPAPLAVFDPGLDSITGQSIFLEGHRQNAAMFADTGASANLGGLSWLTPALMYQYFAPLLIILLGHGALVREREAATLAPMLAQGVSGSTLFAGKALALLSVVALLLLPLLFCAVFSMTAGETLPAVAALAGLYLLYLSVWGLITLAASLLFRQRSTILVMLSLIWLGATLLLPAIAVNLVANTVPRTGKVETDLAVLAELRKQGDGHNASDPAFAQLRSDLLTRYGVSRVEDLPVNLRGLVAQHAEEKLTLTLNEFAEQRMAQETAQADALARYGWISPLLAVGTASRRISGTDLDHYHRFLREAEQLRFEFVQALNGIHAEQLAYSDDINRSSDPEAERRTRVDSANWAMLDSFRFIPASIGSRLASAAPVIAMLLVWFGSLAVVTVGAARRLRPV